MPAEPEKGVSVIYTNESEIKSIHMGEWQLYILSSVL